MVGREAGEQLWETKRKNPIFTPPNSCSCSCLPKLANPGMDPPAGSHWEEHGAAKHKAQHGTVQIPDVPSDVPREVWMMPEGSAISCGPEHR